MDLCVWYGVCVCVWACVWYGVCVEVYLCMVCVRAVVFMWKGFKGSLPTVAFCVGLAV